MQRQEGGIGTIRRAMVGALSMAILAFPAVAEAGGAVSKAAAFKTQVRQTGAFVRAHAKAQESNPRELGGFIFQPSTMLEGPFITNHVRIATGMGVLRQRGVKPESQTPGAPAAYNLRIGAFHQHTSVGVALTPKVGLGLDGGIIGYGGANSQTTLQVGSGVGFEARPGIKFGLVNNQNYGIALAMRAYGRAAQAMGSRVDAMAQQVGTQKALNTVEVQRTQMSSLGGGLSLSAAKSIGRHAGVQVEIGGEGARAMSGNAIQGRVESHPRTLYAGTAASIDLSPIAPVGAMIEYRMDRSVIPVAASSKAGVSAGDVGHSNMHRMSAGLYYTASKNLVLGAVGTYGLARGNMPGAPATHRPARIMGGQLTVGYYF